MAVLDLGKTNAKMVVYGADGRTLGEARSRAEWRVEDGVLVLDEPALRAWVEEALARFAEDLGVGRLMITTHGCTFALVDAGGLTAPILDYEQDAPPDVERAFAALAPPFSETFTPPLPAGLNVAKHILWRAMADPALMARTEAILFYPQYWTWTLAGRERAALASEVSYLGCHSHLWSPARDDFSSLVDREGWRPKMPPLRAAGAPMGTHRLRTRSGEDRAIAVHNGVHDSNAALAYYRAVGFEDITLVSTGTWVIVFNPACPLDALDARRDMLANVTVDRAPVATARFMGGREFDVISGGARAAVTREGVERVMAAGAFALPSFAAGGPFPGCRGAFAGPEPAPDDRPALALLYVACMTHRVLDLIGSRNTVVVDGGLVTSPLFAELLASLRRGQTVQRSLSTEGTSAGAAALAFATIGVHPFQNRCFAVAAREDPALERYYRAWCAEAEARLAAADQP